MYTESPCGVPRRLKRVVLDLVHVDAAEPLIHETGKVERAGLEDVVGR
jgi:hypothetical protein